jgi:hypothetical protein
LNGWEEVPGTDHLAEVCRCEQLLHWRFQPGDHEGDLVVMSHSHPFGDAALLIESLAGPIHFRALISGAPIDDDYLHSIVRMYGLRLSRFVPRRS